VEPNTVDIISTVSRAELLQPFIVVVETFVSALDRTGIVIGQV